MAGDGLKILQFVPFTSCVEPSFWYKLTELKLDVDKLDETERHIWGYYCNTDTSSKNNLLTVDCSSFNEIPTSNNIVAKGTIINKNTVESFKDCDKNQLINEKGSSLWREILEKAIDEPYRLNQFFILSFADLKKYHFYYWFSFPVLKNISVHLEKSEKIGAVLSKEQVEALRKSYLNLESKNKNFFGVIINEKIELITLKETILRQTNEENLFWCYSDPCNNSDDPGWPLRNYINFIHKHQDSEGKCLKVIGLKICSLVNNPQEITIEKSIVLTVQFIRNNHTETNDLWVGWERNERGKMGPRMCNLSQTMDPIRLAEASVDLNLKLMKWQLVPDLNLEIVKNTSCLLLGSGTLGCAVGRSLLSWGVRNITFVDNGQVSYSNPIRQNLYTFQDSVLHSYKAETAAQALAKIFPGVNSKGYTLNIPMPGHPVGSSLLEETRESIQLLEELIASHEVIFLLMDSRESRWLPTVISSSKRKLVINAALGFDSYLVMRHGLKPQNSHGENESKDDLNNPSVQLGCYFCNDVTAPGNSGKSRTLDQQCTVTRPGVSNIAAALAVELMVSVLQHPLTGMAPVGEDDSTVLGIIPHSIRGFLSHYQTVLPSTEAFNSCIACSDRVVTEYESHGFDFILKCLESKEYLEDLTGLSILHLESEKAEIFELTESEEEDVVETK